MGVRYDNKTTIDRSAPLPSPSPSADSAIGMATSTGSVRDWVEIWEYAAGLRFRGFVSDKDGISTLFIFFDHTVIGPDLKNGYATMPCFSSYGESLLTFIQTHVPARTGRQRRLRLL
jgi:hypothetical protein